MISATAAESSSNGLDISIPDHYRHGPSGYRSVTPVDFLSTPPYPIPLTVSSEPIVVDHGDAFALPTDDFEQWLNSVQWSKSVISQVQLTGNRRFQLVAHRRPRASAGLSRHSDYQ